MRWPTADPQLPIPCGTANPPPRAAAAMPLPSPAGGGYWDESTTCASTALPRQRSIGWRTCVQLSTGGASDAKARRRVSTAHAARARLVQVRKRSVLQGSHYATSLAVVLLVVIDPLPALRRGKDWQTWLEGQQRLDQVMSRVAPPLFVSTAATALGAAGLAAAEGCRVRAGWRALAAGGVVAAVLVTLRVNEPINDRLRRWRPADPPATGWREDRAQWERGHRVRRALLAGSAVATVAGALTDC